MEVKLRESISVLHRHMFSSCRGTLSATSAGLRFEANQGHDNFVASFGELDRFEIDYLKKKLSIKLRGGRNYDFTDPDGNADRLFVFHRDVEKAREKLAHGGVRSD